MPDGGAARAPGAPRAGAQLALDLEGPGSPPRSNGELVFQAPWESRLFGMTLALCERGVFAWEDFRRLLVDEIARREAGGQPPAAWSYYACWQAAFERLLGAKEICRGAELEARVRELAARPAGHDHDHGHGDHHEG